MSYGFCPTCGARGVSCERRPNGYTFCENGHKYLHRDRVEAPKSKEVVLGEGEITRNGDDRRAWSYIGGKDVSELIDHTLVGKRGKLIFVEDNA